MVAAGSSAWGRQGPSAIVEHDRRATDDVADPLAARASGAHQ
jgi:hypothetical protein